MDISSCINLSHMRGASQSILAKTLSLSVLLTVSLSSIPSAYAGTGTNTVVYGGEGGVAKQWDFAFTVSIRFNATEEQRRNIMRAFMNGNWIVRSATDRQHRFSVIRIVNNDTSTNNDAEFYVNSGAGRAYATDFGYGVPGAHINMYYDSDFTNANGTDPDGIGGDSMTVAHEFAHHAYGVLDEYKGPNTQEGADCAVRPDASNLNFCLMDNYYLRRATTRKPGYNYTLFDFCVASNHDPDSNTDQSYYRGKSCWSLIGTVGRKNYAKPPTGLPQSLLADKRSVQFVGDVPSNPPTGRIAGLSLAESQSDSRSSQIKRRSVMYVLDQEMLTDATSPSFGQNLAEGLILRSSDTSTRSGVIFAKSNRRSLPLSENSLLSSSGGKGTDVESALRVALAEITQQPNRTLSEKIVLITDGKNFVSPSESLLDELRSQHVSVSVIAVAQADTPVTVLAELKQLSVDARGTFSQSYDDLDAKTLLFQASQEGMGQSLIAKTSSILGGKKGSASVLVEKGARSVTFAAIAESVLPEGVAITLYSPSGKQFDAKTTKNGVVSDSLATTLTVQSPEVGVWKMITSTNKGDAGRVLTIAYASNNTVQLVAQTSADVLKDDEVVITAESMFAGERVVGTAISGILTRPDGTQLSFPLYDDGKKEHGDVASGDGIYSTRFVDLSDSGAYTFGLEAQSDQGKLHTGETMFPAAPRNQTVPTFRRSTAVTVIRADRS